MILQYTRSGCKHNVSVVKRYQTTGQEPRFGSINPIKHLGSLVQPGPVWSCLKMGHWNVPPKDRMWHCKSLRLSVVWGLVLKAWKLWSCWGSPPASIRGGFLSLQPVVSYSSSPVLWLCSKIQYVLTFQHRKEGQGPTRIPSPFLVNPPPTESNPWEERKSEVVGDALGLPKDVLHK